MPRRRRVSKARILRLTGQEHGALRFGTAATMEYVFGSLDVAREAWSVHRMRMLAACGENGTRPEAFWLFEAPAELHTWAPHGLEATATARGIAEYRRRRMDLAARRLAWLSSAPLG